MYELESTSGPSSQRSPVSSLTSRRAQSSSDSPSSAFPFGSDQSSYAGRWTSRTSSSPSWFQRTTTPPAARTRSLIGEPPAYERGGGEGERGGSPSVSR